MNTHLIFIKKPKNKLNKYYVMLFYKYNMKNLEDIIKQNYNKKNKDNNLTSTYQYSFLSDDRIEISENNVPIIEAEYKSLGIYNLYNSVWYWSYNVFLANKNTVVNKDIVKKYNDKLLIDMKNYTDISYVEYVNYITSNDNFYISLKNLDMVIQVALHIFDYDWYVMNCGNGNLTCKVDEVSSSSDKIKKLEYIIIKNFTLL